MTGNKRLADTIRLVTAARLAALAHSRRDPVDTAALAPVRCTTGVTLPTFVVLGPVNTNPIGSVAPEGPGLFFRPAALSFAHVE